MGKLVKAEILVMQIVFTVTTEWPGLSKTRATFGIRKSCRAQCSSGTFLFIFIRMTDFSVLRYDFYLCSF